MTLADKAVVFIAVLAAGLSFYFAWQPSAPGTLLEIYQDNTLYERHSLNEPATLNVPGKLGDSVIEIDHGRARFQSSPCTSKFCVHAGWMQQAGDVIACLPNGVHIQIHGGQGRFDAIAF